MHIYIYTDMHIHTHLRIHIHIRTYAHTLVQSRRCFAKMLLWYWASIWKAFKPNSRPQKHTMKQKTSFLSLQRGSGKYIFWCSRSYPYGPPLLYSSWTTCTFLYLIYPVQLRRICKICSCFFLLRNATISMMTLPSTQSLTFLYMSSN